MGGIWVVLWKERFNFRALRFTEEFQTSYLSGCSQCNDDPELFHCLATTDNQVPSTLSVFMTEFLTGFKSVVLQRIDLS